MEEKEVRDNVIDLMAARIERFCRDAETTEELEVAESLYEMYTTGEVSALMKDGQVFFQYVGDDLLTSLKGKAQ